MTCEVEDLGFLNLKQFACHMVEYLGFRLRYWDLVELAVAYIRRLRGIISIVTSQAILEPKVLNPITTVDGGNLAPLRVPKLL